VFVLAESLNDLWSKEEVVYLTAESDNVLTELSDKKIYVIGGEWGGCGWWVGAVVKCGCISGLIDHNHKKGLCLEYAKRRGYHHARLPIPEFIELKSRKVSESSRCLPPPPPITTPVQVLSITHVFETLLHFSESGNWEEALLSVIPQRKGARPVAAATDGGAGEAIEGGVTE
jgi:tRNA (guanine9-N1)-methyltransferase